MKSYKPIDLIVGAFALVGIGASVYLRLVPLRVWLYVGGAIVVCAVMVAVYQKYREVEQERDELLEAKPNNAKRKAVRRLLGEAQESGQDLAAQQYFGESDTEQAVERWIQDTYDLIEAAFGKQEALTFKNNDNYPFEESRIIAIPDPRLHDVSLMKVRLWRLRDLGRKAHGLLIRGRFRPPSVGRSL